MSRSMQASLSHTDRTRTLNGRGRFHNARPCRKTNLALENLETRNLLAVLTFQQGAGGYEGAQDTVLYSITPTENFGTESGMSVDQQDAGGVRQGLMRFDDILGEDPGQIPLGSSITSATLTVNVFNDSNTAMQMSMYRMKTDWNQSTATWNSFGLIGGVNAAEGESNDLPPDAVLLDSSTGTKTFDVTTSLRHWASGETNLGWLIESASTNGWDFNTSEAALANRPILAVNFTPPSGAGEFQFLDLAPRVAEGDSGSSVALLSVSRLGGVSGAVSVDYTVAAGTATSGVDFVSAGPVTLNFAAGETTKTIPVTINGDTALEGLETLTVALSNPQGGASIKGGAGSATLTIADDDALINEVLANVTNATLDETNREYIELIGTPGASLNGYYFVIFEGEEEENSGAGSGIADLVIDLAGQSFGSNGLLVVTGTEWAYVKDPATNQLATDRLDGVGGRIEDSSQTYALIRSPGAAIVEGTDYDTVGAYEDATQTAIGTGVGILDQLPAGAQLVDSVGVVEGGGSDRDRVATTPEAGHPGIHVHQPEGLTSATPAASDAVSRRLGQDTPSTIGVWFNGDIADGAANPITYPNGTTAISVVAPGGSVITPGAPNILRNVFLTVTQVSVDETAGTVTLTVERSDTASAISVDYTSVDGTATAGSDYTASNGTLNFGIGDSSEDIVISINSDGTPEADETFDVQLAGATVPFLITVPSVRVTIEDADVTVATFQDFFNGYTGTADTYLNSLQPNDPFGGGSTVIIDEEVGEQTGTNARPSQGLLRFDDLFGGDPGQIPLGSRVFGATLTLNVFDATAPDAGVRLFRMLKPWDEGTATWNNPQGLAGGSIINGLTPDDVEATADVDSLVTNPAGGGPVDIPLNIDTIQAWANGASPNYGWSIVSDSADDWSFFSADDFINPVPLTPKLTIFYTPPSGEGSFGFSRSDYKVSESGTAVATVQRIGGSTSAATVDYQITAGTGSLSDITGSAAGVLNFAPGELFKTVSIPAFNDTELERNETLQLSLSGAGLDFSRPTATLTIRDNDFQQFSPAVLLNEMFINSPGNDGRSEFVELSGTAGIGMGSLYFAIFNGDVGEGEGATDLVVDLGTFANGASGFSIITALNGFNFRVPDGTTQIARPELDREIVSNDTATYALLWSPNTSLLSGRFDYDWDNDGSLELPSGAVIIDSIAIQDDGALDQTYGPAANRIDSTSNPTLFVADAVSRKRGVATQNSAAAWFNGDLIGSPDDPLVYDGILDPADPGDLNNAMGLPFNGAALSPGEINTGTTVQSPLVSLTSIAPNSPTGSVTLTFNGPISQLLGDENASGITITDVNGDVDSRVNVEPIVTGLGTNTLTLQFQGAGVSAGLLPAGNFQLNINGLQLIGNARAVDAANNMSATGSDFEFEFSQPFYPKGDLDFDGDTDFDDIDDFVLGLSDPAAYEAIYGLPPAAIGDLDGDGDQDFDDIQGFVTALGEGSAGGSASATATTTTQDADADTFGVPVGETATLDRRVAKRGDESTGSQARITNRLRADSADSIWSEEADWLGPRRRGRRLA